MKEQQVLFGISPFNSRFSEVYLEKMLNWGFDNYDKVDILHPHEEAKYLLMGCGDNENKAKKSLEKNFTGQKKLYMIIFQKPDAHYHLERYFDFPIFMEILPISIF